ncbi:MAG: hypothetical protein ACREWG_04345 [Gammaproteobacteria bacterium]
MKMGCFPTSTRVRGLASYAALSLFISIGLARQADAQDRHDHAGPGRGEVGSYGALAGRPSAAYIESAPPLWTRPGGLEYKITTGSERAQRYFDQGLRLTYAFNHAEARRAFRQAQRLDPRCALCYWGEALVLGPNINAPMDAEAKVPALAALRKAQQHAPLASAKEQTLIAALARRYSDDQRVDRKTLDAAYAAAMGQVAARFPDDLNIAVLYAEALMDLSPWDYWETGGRRPKGRTQDILKVLEAVLAKHPDHAGAIHYYIHVVEASARPQRAERYADRLAALDLGPGTGHLVHMPSHLYFRIGRYLDSLAANRRAVAADETYLREIRATGIYAEAYYPHAIHMLLVSAQMAGDGKTAIEAAQRLQTAVSDEAVRTIPWVQPIKSAPYFAHAQLSAPSTILALRDPGNAFPYVKAAWHYARGVAFAARREVKAAEREAQLIAALRCRHDFAALMAGGVPAKEVLDLAQHVVLARIAQAQGKLARAAAEFEQAVAIEDRLGYMEPPYWYYPVRQSLGAVRLLAGDLSGAEHAFRASLARTPNNGWALYGLREMYARRGDTHAVRDVQHRLAKAWGNQMQKLDLNRL